MAHMAHVDADGRVTSVHAVANEAIGGGVFPDDEPTAQAFMATLGSERRGYTGTWLMTSYNSNFRGRFAGRRSRYDPDLDEFVRDDA